MRIAFLTVSAEMGGSERSLVELLRGLRRLHPDWALDVIVPREGLLSTRVRELGAAVIILPMPSSLARFGESGRRGLASRGAALLGAASSAAGYVRRLARLLDQRGTDVIHSNGFKFHVLAVRAASPGTAIVWHIHEYVSPRRLSRTLLRRLANRVAVAVANSHSVARDLVESIGAGPRIETVYNGIDLDEYSPAGDVADVDALGGKGATGEAVVRIGLVATFGRWKGHDVFLKAIAALDPALPVRAYIVGAPVYDTSGSQYTLEELQRMTREAGLDGRVVFTGFVDRTAPVLRALDVVVHASTLPEPFGLAIAEGMACGRAVVVSAAGGAAEIVRSGHDALTHPPGDVTALAGALARLARDGALRQQLGAAARQSALEKFDAMTFARGFASIYASVATGGRVTRQ